MLQGSLSDARTHVGQLSMLQRLEDAPIPQENFIFAVIKKGMSAQIELRQSPQIKKAFC